MKRELSCKVEIPAANILGIAGFRMAFGIFFFFFNKKARELQSLNSIEYSVTNSRIGWPATEYGYTCVNQFL